MSRLCNLDVEIPNRCCELASTRIGRWWCVLLLSLAMGCAQRNFYNAGSLPNELRAPPIASVQKVDLSALARGNVKGDMVYPGDLLAIQMINGLEEKLPEPSLQRVADDGTVDVPLVGPVPVAGLTYTATEKLIQDEATNRGVYRSPSVTVSLKERRSNHVTVMGAVNEPGMLRIPVSSSDVLTAIVQAGGLADDAGVRVEVRHPAGFTTVTENATPSGGPLTELAGWRRRRVPVPPRSSQIDLAQASKSDNADLHLEDGSVVMVMKQPERMVQVTGLVKKSDRFKLPSDQDLYLLDAIALAGGQTMDIADKVRITRKMPNRDQPVVIEASVKQAKRDGRANVRLIEGDVVSIEETPVTFVVSTVRDFAKLIINVALPGL